MSSEREIWAERARSVLSAESEDFRDLIDLASLNPKKELRFQDWSGVDFSGCDLRGFDFTASRLRGCKFEGTLIEGARFDQAEINSSNLRAAKDWERHVKYWRKAESLPPDSHLPVGAVFQDAPFAPEMVVIPPGAFMMGSPPDERGRDDDEGPLHDVIIPDRFAVGRYPVTFEEWDAAFAAGGVKYNPEDRGWGRGRWPVIDVTWEDAQAYVRWLSERTGSRYRLLSEAEWEYVCRAGTETAYWFGDQIREDQANFGGSNKKTSEVGAYPPNGFGVYDMHGNVREWCEDRWHGSYEEKPGDLKATGGAWVTGNDETRVLRGGSCFIDPRFLRSADRLRYYLSEFRNLIIGFRVARTITS